MKPKPCKTCNKVPNESDLPNSLYCFSCDALFCPACIKRQVRKDAGKWMCPFCRQWWNMESSYLFREKGS
jgi:hypothetical protein